MNFQGLKNIDKPDFYIDLAFRKAKERALYEKSKKKTTPKIEQLKDVEIARINTIKNTITSKFDQIIQSFPKMDELPPFYNELIKCTLEYGQIKRSLGGVNWASKKTKDFHKIYHNKIRSCKDAKKTEEYRKAFFGRIASFIKQIREELSIIEDARKTMKGYPNVKTSVFTASLVGFPNIGKTTLLYKLTGSKPSINNYAFTTKGVNVSYLDNKKVQILDTPGTLNRFNKMNNIERIAYLAMKHCSQLLIYIFDLTEPFPLKDQEKLYKAIKETKIPMIIYLSKTDVLDKKVVDEFRKTHKCVTLDELKYTLSKSKEKFYEELKKREAKEKEAREKEEALNTNY